MCFLITASSCHLDKLSLASYHLIRLFPDTVLIVAPKIHLTANQRKSDGAAEPPMAAYYSTIAAGCFFVACVVLNNIRVKKKLLRSANIEYLKSCTYLQTLKEIS